MRFRFEFSHGRWIAGVFIVLGFVFESIGGIWAQRTSQFRADAREAEGVVVEMRNVGRGMYEPTIEFEDAAGRRRLLVANASNPPAFNMGERVRVLYQADDPANAMVNSFWQLWLGPGIFLLLGSVFVLVGGLAWWFLGRGFPVAHSVHYSRRIEFGDGTSMMRPAPPADAGDKIDLHP